MSKNYSKSDQDAAVRVVACRAMYCNAKEGVPCKTIRHSNAGSIGRSTSPHRIRMKDYFETRGHAMNLDFERAQSDREKESRKP